LAILFLVANRIYALDELELKVASFVTKFKDGYLVSIVPKETTIDSTGMEEYLAEPPEKKVGWIYKEINKSDYPLMESRFHSSLKNNLIIYGRNSYTNIITTGENYYLQYNELGHGLHIDDILVFVKGTMELERINPVWAKNYFAGDETFKWREAPEIKDYDENSTQLLERINKFVRGELNWKAKKEGVNYSIFGVSNHYREEAYLVKLKSTTNKNCLVIVNGESFIKHIKYGFAIIVDEEMRRVAEIIPPTIYQGHEGFYSTFKLNQVYYSEKLKTEYIIAGYSGCGQTYLIFQGKKWVRKKPIFVRYCD
jgi:hypothetical protein